jgi:hypothetical protein
MDQVNRIDLDGLEPDKGERSHTGSPGGTCTPDKHWKDDPNEKLGKLRWANGNLDRCLKGGSREPWRL